MKLPIAMLFAILPGAFEDLPTRKIKNSTPVLKTIFVLALVLIPIRPSKYASAFNNAIFPISSVAPIVHISKSSPSVEFAVFELAFIDAWVTDIPSYSFFDAFFEVSFVIGAIWELFLAAAWRYIKCPFTLIIIALIRIMVGAIAVGIIISDSPFINASIIENISSFSFRFALVKGSLIIWAIFKKELPFSMKLVILPLAQVEAARRLHLLYFISFEPSQIFGVFLEFELGQLSTCLQCSWTEVILDSV